MPPLQLGSQLINAQSWYLVPIGIPQRRFRVCVSTWIFTATRAWIWTTPYQACRMKRILLGVAGATNQNEKRREVPCFPLVTERHAYCHVQNQQGGPQ